MVYCPQKKNFKLLKKIKSERKLSLIIFFGTFSLLYSTAITMQDVYMEKVNNNHCKCDLKKEGKKIFFFGWSAL